MTDKSRQQEDHSSMMKGPPSSAPQLQAGLMPHPFGLSSDSSLGLTTHHPLAYGIMHQPLSMGRVAPNTANDLGPPIFMPSLNLGVPRQTTSTMTQSSKQAKPFMQEVMPFPPQSLIFHPSPVRPTNQPAYLSPGSPPVNIKLPSSKPGPTKSHVSKNPGVVRPTPKQPTPTSTAAARPKRESSVDHITHIHSPTQGPYVLPMASQKCNTLSKMLMIPAQQQTSVVSSTGQLQQKGVVDVGGAYVSHNTTLRTAVPTLTSIATGKGSFSSTAPGGYPGRPADHMTTSGQSTSTASFTDTKNERPPQPSAAHSPLSQPLPQGGMAKDKSNIAIIKGSSLTGRHIAAITNNTTLQHTASGSMQPAYTQGSISQTMDSIKSEYEPVDTGWSHPPPEHPPGNQLFANQIQHGKSEGVSVPTVTAPGALGLTTQTASSGGSNMPGSPVRASGPHPQQQGVGSSPRPQILRKRALDSSLPQGEFPPVPLSPTSEGSVAPHNHIGVRSEGGEVLTSPRKKPRKQNMVANDDLYASNVPDSLSSSSASSLDTPLLVDGLEESGRSLTNSGLAKSSRVKRDSSKDGASGEVEIRYLSQLRRCPYPISSLHKVYNKAPHNHFKQYSDIKHREETTQSALQLASDCYALQRAEGWRVHHVIRQIDEMARVEQELLETVQSLQKLSDTMRASDKCAIEPSYLDNFKELTECNLARSTRILSHIESTRTKSLQLLEHQSQVTELLIKCRPPSPLSPHHLTNHLKTS